MGRRLALLACLCACGLFPDLGDLSAGDASADATTDVVSDVTSDAGADAPSDASLDVRTSPCSAKHTFCDDFDDGSLGAAWDKTVNAGGTISQSTNAVSAPYALQATVPAGNHPYVVLQKYFSPANHFHYECDLVVVGAQDGGMEVDYFDLAFSESGYASASINMERLNPGGDLEQYTRPTGADAGTYQENAVAEDFSTWKHLAIDVDFVKGTYSAAVNGASIDTMSLNPTLAPAQSTLSVGITYSGGLKTSWSVLVDNVVVDLQ